MRLILSVLLFGALLCARTELYAQTGIRGFSRDAAKQQRQLEAKGRSFPDQKRLREYMHHMAGEPHIAGSPASKAIAEYALQLMRSWGLPAQIEEFEALLPYPVSRSLEMTAPVKYTARMKEPVIPEDKDSGDRDQVDTYNSFAASGDVTGLLVYVNYGTPEDYEQLAKLGIDVKGKIVIARYGRSWRGTKALTAQENGAAGCLIYSDPKEDGYWQGDMYPKGAHRPPKGVQRGSVMDMPLYAGDPLSPGWASEKGARKLTREEAKNLIRIPVLPISFEDAQPLLANLGGPIAPEAWRGALALTYHIGPGPAEVHLQTKFDDTVKPVYNVLATIPGTEAPDEWVIYGNHHDAWVNGAADPVSGAIALLETARSLSELVKAGWKPKRTIKLALWDAEEFGLIGSTEWAEKHAAELRSKAVVYFNSDMNTAGTLAAGGSPSLETFYAEVARDNLDPLSGEALDKTARARTAQGENQTSDKRFRLGPLGAGSDYVAFLHHLGIASVESSFRGAPTAGIYHSIYDSIDWYERYGDKDYAYGKALAQVMVTAITRMAEAEILPFDFRTVGRSVREYATQIAENRQVDMRPVTGELDKLDAAARRFEDALRSAAESRSGRTNRTATNQALMKSERALLNPQGLPGRSWYKHQLAAPGRYTGYSAKTLAGIREAADAKRFDEAKREVQNVAAALRAYTRSMEEATQLLGSR